MQDALGDAATFRPGQLEAIEALVEERGRVLVVQATGWGKSVVYFLATRLLRDAGAGPTFLVSPLLSLMRDQIRMAERLGVNALTINSSNTADWPEVRAVLARDQCDLLLVSPERLGNEEFVTETLASLQGGIGLFVVDEAHCISDWGHDFRPDYRRIVRIVRQLPGSVPVLATTATANDRVVADVQEQLGPGLRVLRGPLARKSLRLQSIRLADQAERLAWLAQHLPELPGAGIVYCLTVADCLRVSGWLRSRRIDVEPYFGDLPSEVRSELEERLLDNGVKALVATVALGMGFDKPDLGFVIHFQRPGSIVAYYQQIGRAGRSVADAHAILLNGREDDEIHDYFIREAFPGIELLREVLAAIEANPGVGRDGVSRLVDLKQSRIEQCLKFLEVDQAIYREGRGFYRAPRGWTPDVERMEAVTQRRRDELEKMRELSETAFCLMEYIIRELDDPDAVPCGRCANCSGEGLPVTVEPALVREAIAFLRRAYRPISPRRQWPAGVMGDGRRSIAKEHRAEKGRALAIWGDAGWGRLVQEGKYVDERFADDLVEALVQLIVGWNPLPRPCWVTSVPSIRHPELVSNLALRLADRLGLPFEPVLRKQHETPPQKEQQNSSYQARNVREAFSADRGRVRREPVLLVDDVVDSGWTFTECALQLRLAGCQTVFPVALAEAGPAWRGDA